MIESAAARIDKGEVLAWFQGKSGTTPTALFCSFISNFIFIWISILYCNVMYCTVLHCTIHYIVLLFHNSIFDSTNRSFFHSAEEHSSH